jgi:hypothetical protein
MRIAAGMIAMALAAPAMAAEPQAPQLQLQLRPKSALALAPAHDAAPFVVHPLVEPEITVLPQPLSRPNESRSACDGASAVCYDPSSGRIEVASARNFMPDIPGLRRETISVKRDRILFRYSF